MIDVKRAEDAFLNWLQADGFMDEPGHEMKRVHTFHVAELSRCLAERITDDDLDPDLAYVIGLLHDIGRFGEMRIMHRYDGTRFDHAAYGAALLFDQGLIRQFVQDGAYDAVIRTAIENHSRLAISPDVQKEALPYAKLLRDADKLDNYRVKLNYEPEQFFPGMNITRQTLEDSLISPPVMDAVHEHRCVRLQDRRYPLDYYICIMAFAFDLNYPQSRSYVREQNYIRRMTDAYSYRNARTSERMQEICRIIEQFLEL